MPSIRLPNEGDKKINFQAYKDTVRGANTALNATGSNGINVSTVGDALQVSWAGNTVDIEEHWLGMIVATGPNGCSVGDECNGDCEFKDNRYWVKKIGLNNFNSRDTINGNTFTYSVDSTTQNSIRWVAVTNLSESQSQTHTLRHGQIVKVMMIKDTGETTHPHFVMSEGVNPVCCGIIKELDSSEDCPTLCSVYPCDYTTQERLYDCDDVLHYISFADPNSTVMGGVRDALADGDIIFYTMSAYMAGWIIDLQIQPTSGTYCPADKLSGSFNDSIAMNHFSFSQDDFTLTDYVHPADGGKHCPDRVLIDWFGFSVATYAAEGGGDTHVCAKQLYFDWTFTGTDHSQEKKYQVAWLLTPNPNHDNPCSTCDPKQKSTEAVLHGDVYIPPCDFLPSAKDCSGTITACVNEFDFGYGFKLTSTPDGTDAYKNHLSIEQNWCDGQYTRVTNCMSGDKSCALQVDLCTDTVSVVTDVVCDPDTNMLNVTKANIIVLVAC